MILDTQKKPSHGFKSLAFRGLSGRGSPFTFRQFAKLRLGLMARFAAVGALGALLNLAVMAVILGLGSHYLLAAIVATELTILSNFLIQEQFVFRDDLGGRPFWQRLLASFGFNNIETLLRIPVLILLVEALLLPGVLAQALTLAVAFLARFAFTSKVIYRVASPVIVPVRSNASPSLSAGVETA